MVALLTREALQVVDVGARPHHHLEGRDHFIARRAVSSRAKEPEGGGEKANSVLIHRMKRQTDRQTVQSEGENGWSKMQQFPGLHATVKSLAPPEEDPRPHSRLSLPVIMLNIRDLRARKKQQEHSQQPFSLLQTVQNMCVRARACVYLICYSTHVSSRELRRRRPI